jgi:hypothetical protein
LYGGSNESGSVVATFGDLWKFTPSASTWTWVQGSNLQNAPPVYGIQGVAAAANSPGARCGASTWIDAAGNLWLFGGTDSSGAWRNDLWQYSSVTGYWAWISGTNLQNATGTYGTQGVASSAYAPGSRSQAISWIAGSGNLWMFGGFNYSTGFNDLWVYNPTGGTWTWVSGSNSPVVGVYGTQGVGATGTVPGSRYGSASWVDLYGNLWLFGGWDEYDGNSSSEFINFYFNDLWKFTP